MNRAILALGAILLAAVSAAQNPDLMANVDVRLALHGREGKDFLFRLYDPLGRHSTVGLTATLEPGFQVLVSQRLQLIPGNPDDEQLDEYYIEDAGYWRAGKQYLTFGKGALLKDNAMAARLDTRVGGDEMPAVLIACSGESDQTNGLVARIGERLGLSFAIGSHFSIASTSLTAIRRPEDSPGEGRGYRRAFGIDYGSRRTNWGGQVELAFLEGGHSALDRNKAVSDVSFFLENGVQRKLTVGWSRDWTGGDEFFRLEGRVLAVESVWIEPLVRLKDGRLFDLALTINVRV